MADSRRQLFDEQSTKRLSGVDPKSSGDVITDDSDVMCDGVLIESDGGDTSNDEQLVRLGGCQHSKVSVGISVVGGGDPVQLMEETFPADLWLLQLLRGSAT
jgi:hypothetical protein